MSYENYDDVRSQLMDAGLLLDGELRIGGSRSARCRVDGRGREKRGWYWLHDVPLDGRYYLVGAYGVYEGNSPNTQKIELTKQCEGEGCKRSVSFKEKNCPHCGSPVRRRELSKEQQAAMRARLADDKKREEARRRRELERAARRAEKMWINKCLPIAEQATCEYLVKRGIQPHKTRMTPNGSLVVPMQDVAGRVWGLQFIGPEVRKKLKDDDKQFWPYGTSQTARFFMLGAPGDVILICEGFVTGAALHEETGLCVVVAFTAGNLQPVADVIHKKYRSAKLLLCADDDFATRGNPGVSAATTTAMAVGGAWVAPVFPADEPVRVDIAAAKIDFESKDYKLHVEAIRRGRKKLTDFDDLRTTSTPHAVQLQIEAKLAELGWVAKSAAPLLQPGGGGKELTPITGTQELFDRFAIVYGHNKALFDFHEHMLVSVDDMKLACSGREIWRTWLESQDKKIVRIENVGFDPGGEDKNITCNLFDKWPTEPKQGECGLLIQMLEYMCSNEKNAADLKQWVLRWLAYPIRNPGAKMKTALMFHGWQGVGKNLFFEIIMAIYGKYGRIIDQSALEDKHNDTFSKKLFFIADEVVARQELYHVKGKIKGIITGEWIRINPKNVGAYHERNHANLVFLSNEILPVVIDKDDRRFTVVWTPGQLSEQFYKDIRAEVDAGGIAALHYHLKYELDMGNFTPWTRPPMTGAKKDLIEISMDSTERFWIEWIKGHIDLVPALPVKSTQLYAFYREWCARSGYARYAPETKFLAEIGKRTDGKKQQARYLNGSGEKMATFIYPPNSEQPADKTQAIWLGENVKKFASAVSLWREETENRA